MIFALLNEYDFYVRINTLEGELEKVRKREAEDTKVLEDAVKMVEQNLQKSTVRIILVRTLWK